MDVPFYIPTNNEQTFYFLHILANSCYYLFFFFFDSIIPNGYQVVSHFGFELHFPQSWLPEGRGGEYKREKGVKYLVTERDLTLRGEHRMQYTSDVL